MKNGILYLIFALLGLNTASAQITYWTDILNNGFKQATIVQPSDYEGSVTCTLIRKLAPEKTDKAVLYVHGFNDYFFQQEMADRFIKEGYNFYAVDLRKYGRSWLAHQKLNNVRDLSEYFADIDTVLNVMRGEGSEKILLSGHSLGALTVSLYAAERNGKEKFDAVFLNSPFYALPTKSVIKKTALPLIVKRAEKHPATSIDLEINPLYGESLYKGAHGEWDYNLSWKPLIVPEVNYGWIRAVHNGLLRLSQGLQINKPVLIMHATKSIEEKKWSDVMFTGDAVLNVTEMVAQTKNIEGQFSIQAVPGGMHDLILSRKPVRDDVYSIMFGWIKRNIK
jgi:alpha-beta hydrolase superfamily lysophospholipase